MPSLNHRVGKLEKWFGARHRPHLERDLVDTGRTQRKAVTGRFLGLVGAVGGLLTAEEQVQVRDGIEVYRARRNGPFAHWLANLLVFGRSRLPAMDPDAFKGLLLDWLSPHVDTFSQVCMRCGLECPRHKSPPLSEWRMLPDKTPGVGEPPWYDLPEFYTGCPYCGRSLRDFSWAHQVEDNQYPWMQLDGYAPGYTTQYRVAALEIAQRAMRRRETVGRISNHKYTAVH